VFVVEQNLVAISCLSSLHCGGGLAVQMILITHVQTTRFMTLHNVSQRRQTKTELRPRQHALKLTKLAWPGLQGCERTDRQTDRQCVCVCVCERERERLRCHAVRQL